MCVSFRRLCSTQDVLSSGGPSPMSPYLGLFAPMPPSLRLNITQSWAVQYKLQADRLGGKQQRTFTVPTLSCSPLPAVTALHWERQAKADSCRLHAINAVLGGPVFTQESFTAMVDAFDLHAGLPVGTSRLDTAASVNGSLFAYALQWAGKQQYYTRALSMYATKGTEVDAKSSPAVSYGVRNAVSAFVYSSVHTWALVRSSVGWVELDSLASNPTPAVNVLAIVSPPGIGVEFVYDSCRTASPLRVGYISRRFEEYPGTQLMLRMFEYHDRSRVHVSTMRRSSGVTVAHTVSCAGVLFWLWPG